MGRFVRAPAEVFPNGALVDVANFRPSRMDGRGMDEPKMRDAIIEALNADIALDGNRRHRHHRRRHPSEVKAMMARDVPRGWEAKKIPPGSLQKSKLCCRFISLNLFSQIFYIVDVVEPNLGSDGDRDANKLASLSPGPVNLPTKVRVSQISCGLHHSGKVLGIILPMTRFYIYIRFLFSPLNNGWTSIHIWQQ